MVTLSLSQSDLPEEIEKAIDDLVTAAEDMGASYDAKGFPAPEREAVANEYRSALTAAILSRLGEAQTQIRTQAMEQLAADAGWELDWDRVRAERDALTTKVLELQPALTAALARVERLEKVLEGAVRLLNLHANDQPEAERWTYTVTAEGELRVQMPPGFVAEPHSALTEAGRLAIKDA